jgi:arylsulfatase A-like enzyme
VRFPGVVEAGSKNETPIAQIDLYPTFLELAGRTEPAGLDGVSLLPAFKSGNLKSRALFWHFPGYLQSYKADPDSASTFFRTTPCSVIRKGDWKLIQYFEDGVIELYNLKNDPSEKTNLASKNEARKIELLAELEAWQKETKAPIPTERNPAYQQ